jgi:hypothetical protein
VYINGRPDHQKNHHDDCIMSISMAIYVAEKSFQSLQKVVNQTKAMLNSWTSNVNENKASSDFFNPMVVNQNNNQGPSKSDYAKHAWLFGSGGRRF